MVFKFNTVRSVTNPAERRQRLAALFAVFEKNTADSSVTLAGENESAAEAHQSTDRQQRHHEKPHRGNGGVGNGNGIELGMVFTPNYTQSGSELQPSSNPYLILNRAPVVRIVEAGRVLATIRLLGVRDEPAN